MLRYGQPNPTVQAILKSVASFFTLLSPSMSQHYSLDRKLYLEGELSIHPDNRSFRYGEGLFETMRLHKGKIPLWDLHWKRLSESLPKLFFQLPAHFSQVILQEEIFRVAQRNSCLDAARVRVKFFKV